jgi:hypothetical protein
MSHQRLATALITRSPAPWPWVSLTRLKWSMSSSSSSAGSPASGHAVDLARQRQLEMRAGWPGRSGHRGWTDPPAGRSAPAARLAAGLTRRGGLAGLAQQAARTPARVQRRPAGRRAGRSGRGEGGAVGVGSLAAGSARRRADELARRAACSALAPHRCASGDMDPQTALPPAPPTAARPMSLAPLPPPCRRPGVQLLQRRLRAGAPLIYQRAGISLHAGKQAMVYSRLSRRLRETSHRSFADYLQWLERAPGRRAMPSGRSSSTA